MEIIKKDSKLYLKVYEISPDTSSDLDWQRTKRFTNWDLAKKYAYELLGYCENGTLFNRPFSYLGEVDDIEPPKLRKKKDLELYLGFYTFKPNKKYAREKTIQIEIIFVEITKEELNELRSLSL